MRKDLFDGRCGLSRGRLSGFSASRIRSALRLAHLLQFLCSHGKPSSRGPLTDGSQNGTRADSEAIDPTSEWKQDLLLLQPELRHADAADVDL
jgi:hypothetical protein